MPRGASENLLSVANSEFPQDPFIHLVTVEWPDGETTRFAKNYEDIVSRGNTYSASAFRVKLPEEPEDSIPKITFEFSIAETELVEKLRLAPEPPTLSLEIVLGNDPDTVEMGPFKFDVRSFRGQGVGFEVEAGFEPVLDHAIPQISYTPVLFPGISKRITALDVED